MKAIPSPSNGDVFIATDNINEPIAILKSRELSDDMRELLAQGYIIPVCKMVLDMRQIRERELEAVIKLKE